MGIRSPCRIIPIIHCITLHAESIFLHHNLKGWPLITIDRIWVNGYRSTWIQAWDPYTHIWSIIIITPPMIWQNCSLSSAPILFLSFFILKCVPYSIGHVAETITLNVEKALIGKPIINKNLSLFCVFCCIWCNSTHDVSQAILTWAASH